MFILIFTWAAMTYLGLDGIKHGDPEVLINGIDYDGRICGVDDGVADKSKVMISAMRCVFGTLRIHLGREPEI